MSDPRQRPDRGRKDDPNLGQKEAGREKTEREEEEDPEEDDDPDLGENDAEQEKADLEKEGGEKDDELEPMIRTMAVSLRLLF
jgi:hypothetical protein